MPADFRFAVKVPRTITHERRLIGADDLLERFLGEAAGLGEKLGPLLVQLPPSVAYDAASSGVLPVTAAALRRVPRVRAAAPELVLARRGKDAGQIGGGPSCRGPGAVPTAAEPGGWDGLVYYRLHGSPRMYYSAYTAEYLDSLAGRPARRDSAGVVHLRQHRRIRSDRRTRWN